MSAAPDEQGWPATERRTPAEECQSCLEHTDDPPGLPAAEVLGDAVAVLRQLADGATPGHRQRHGDERIVYINDRAAGTIRAAGDRALWAAFGPDEARLLADLLERLTFAWLDEGPADAAALDLAYALTGHQRPEVTR